MAEIFVVAGGVFDLAGVIFHLSFRKLFHWQEQLPLLNGVNRAVVPILNYCLTFCFLAFAALAFLHTAELSASALGQSWLGMVGLFWLFRALLQIRYFGLQHWGSQAFLIIFLIGSAIHLIPAIMR